jgi:ribosomal protein L2
MATLGVVSNSDFWSRDLKKAGVKRYYGFRSFVRGVAMNPVDHAHGDVHVVENFQKHLVVY